MERGKLGDWTWGGGNVYIRQRKLYDRFGNWKLKKNLILLWNQEKFLTNYSFSEAEKFRVCNISSVQLAFTESKSELNWLGLILNIEKIKELN